MIRCYVTQRAQADILSCAARAIRDGVDFIQIREKDLSALELLHLTEQILKLAHGSGTRILVNDRLDVALAAGADGVHLPEHGMPAHRVRPYVRVLGVSVHGLEAAVAAERDGADFVVFGPVFSTPGKTAVGVEKLRQVVAALRIPVLAIGGITRDNTAQVLEAGATGFAAIRLFQND